MRGATGLKLLQRDRYDDLFEWSGPHALTAPSLKKPDHRRGPSGTGLHVDQMWLSADHKPNAFAAMKWVVLVNERMNRHAE